MYCPYCASENGEDTTYCRACGKSISIVARSLKGYASVVLASRLDQYFDRPDERLLRDSVISFAIGTVSTTYLFWSAATGGSPLFLLIGVLLPLSVYGFADGIWKAAAYRHCLSLRTHPVQTDDSRECFYCPRCGNQSKEDVNRCVYCGTDLEYVKHALDSSPKSWISHRLEQTIEKHREPRSTFGIAFAVALGVLFFISGTIEEDSLFSLFGFIMAALFVIPGLWDLIVERRRKASTEVKAEPKRESSFALEDESKPLLPKLRAESEIEPAFNSARTRELVERSGGEAKTEKFEES